ncbi:pyridoxal 5'-phosphate synthase [Streptomyces canarius]
MTTHTVTSYDQLPIIDLSAADGDPRSRALLHARLHSAAHDVGFFQLVGHGVTRAETDALLTAMRAFFALPEADRLALDNVGSPHFRGYTRTGDERTGGARDWRDQLDIGAERPARVPGPGEPPYWWLQGPNQWPAALPGLRTAALAWIDRLSGVAHRLLRELLTAIGADLAENPHVSLLFPWHPLARQVIVTGTARRTGRDETAAYFRTRPHGSRLGAWASAQSTVIASRTELDTAYAALEARYPEDEQVPVPPHWGGFRVTPETIEFWQGRENRLHDRLRYVAQPDGTWKVERLSP